VKEPSNYLFKISFQLQVMRVSVIVPAKNVDKKLKLLFDSLNKQILKPHEIIVVYNDVDNDFILLEHRNKVRFLRDKEAKGANYARNRGARVASGDILAFTDSDCIPDNEWISSLMTEFSNFNVDAVAGIVKTYNKESFIARYIGKSFFRPTQFKERKILSKSMGINIAVTSNFAIKRDVLLKIGGFDEEYFRYGSDDVDLVTKLIKNGYKILLSPLPVVYHIERTRLWNIIKRFYEYGKGLSIYRFKHPLTLLSLVSSAVTYGIVSVYLLSAYLMFYGNKITALSLSALHFVFLMVYHLIYSFKERNLERMIYPFLDYILSISSILGILIMDCKTLINKLAYSLKSLFRI